MMSVLRPALVVLFALTLLTGVAYPLAVTGAAKVAFAKQAEGSFFVSKGRVQGSARIAQPFGDPRYFWSRPSATTPFACNASASLASNLGPSNPALVAAVRARVDALRSADPTNAAPIPVDLVTASGSGLDPDLSPAAVTYQLGRVARARDLDPEALRRLVDAHVEEPAFGILGEPRINVLQLNVALDDLQPLKDHESGRAARP